jgi:signal transduction histidine kinase
MRSSLRARLLAWYSAILVAVIATFAGLVGYLLWRSMTAEVDQRLRASAESLVQGLRPSGRGGFDLDLPLEYQAAEAAATPPPVYYAIWTARGELVDRSPVPFDVPLPAAAGTRTRDGRREITLIGAEGAYVLVGRDMAEARAAVGTFAATAAAGGVVALLLSLAGGWFLVGRALAPLHAALERLHTALSAQQRFTADASHELRTPLATMAAEIEWALARPRSADDYRESLATCQRATDRMRSLVGRLLALARADHASGPMVKTAVDLDAAVADAVTLVRPLAERRAVSLEARLAPAVVRGDREQLVDLVTNLCVNAVEYNRPGGRVFVELSREDDVARLIVRDTGVGIAEADVPRIFERFYRTDRARGRESGGTGLGLAIARSIVEAHGGTIACASRLGEGTEMRVTLPLQLPLEARDQAVELRRDGRHGLGTAQVDPGAREQGHGIVAASGAQQVEIPPHA